MEKEREVREKLMTERGEDGCWESRCAWRGMAGEKSQGRANRIRPVETEPH